MGVLSRQRSWNQCVVGSPGAVESQTQFDEPLKRTSNQVATPWTAQAPGAVTCSCSGMDMSCRLASEHVRKSKILVAQVETSTLGSNASTTTCGRDERERGQQCYGWS
jgi:hypothetical protein